MKPRYTKSTGAHPALLDIIKKNTPIYTDLLSKLGRYSTDIQKITKNKEEKSIHWNNGYLPGLDIIILYLMIAEKKPSRFIEVGSGYSTKLAHLVKSKYSTETRIISIDPNPRAFVDDISDQIIRQPFEELDLSSINIASGDILFIDNSHRIFPNSDAMVFFMEVLPSLPKGVIVHLHDIYLPYDYPQFMCDRFYNEQYGLASFLLANPEKYKPILPNYYVSQDKELSNMYKSIWDHENLEAVEQHGGSFWIEIG